jgi:hypothetical protein
LDEPALLEETLTALVTYCDELAEDDPVDPSEGYTEDEVRQMREALTRALTIARVVKRRAAFGENK